MISVKENLYDIKQRIEKSAIKSGRNPSEITLIAVSKTKPVSMLREAYDAGQRILGENKVQELCDKIPQMPEDTEWHLIGHLQRNKVKYIIGQKQPSLIHSVDSERLAAEIDKEAKKKGVTVDILLEVNVANEETKFGISLEQVPEMIDKIAAFSSLRIRGLMTIAPYVENPEENRKIFQDLRKVFLDNQSKKAHNVCMDVLSMGMTNDFEVAVEEGATMVRVGTGIFGERDYTKMNEN
ncbi:MAG: YggS family pyridoxal phosphate-dependent enzyme [Lachnospiraceae bacterium]|nr:YggS family pyridoxal phosphate-dependent enzyme [Lachnospiraceae bacterium]